MKKNSKYKYKCDICGRAMHKKNKAYGYILCMKHMHQYRKYHRFLDDNPRTQNDLNEFRKYDDNTIEFDCYDNKQNVVGHFYIDKKDLKKIRYHKWRIDTNNHVITGSSTNKNPIRVLSRTLLNVNEKDLVVDHIDGNTLNNKRENLRVCTQQQNTQNKHMMSNNKSGTTGVMWDKQRRRWAPEIQWKKQKIHLGRYRDIEEAKFVRFMAEKICFAEFQAYKEQSFETISKERKNELKKYVESKIYNRFGYQLY